MNFNANCLIGLIGLSHGPSKVNIFWCFLKQNILLTARLEWKALFYLVKSHLKAHNSYETEILESKMSQRGEGSEKCQKSVTY